MTMQRMLDGGTGRVCLIGLFLMAVTLPGMSSTARAQESEAPVPPRLTPERAHSRAFFDRARAYLNAHADAPEAPSVLFDIGLTVRAQADKQTAENFMGLLVRRYPRSPQAWHVVESFEGAEAYREFVQELMRRAQDPLVGPDATMMLNAVLLGVRIHGEEVLDKPGFALRVAALADDVGKDGTRDLAMKRFTMNASNQWRKQAADVLLGAQSLPARLEAVYALEQLPDGDFHIDNLLARMTEAQRRQRAVLKIRVARALADNEFEQALSLLADLEPAGDDAAQLQFWRGWAQLASEQADAGLATLRQLRNETPQSEWAALARRIVDQRVDHDVFMRETERALERLIACAAGGFDIFEARFTVHRDNGVPYVVHARVETTDRNVALALSRDDRLLIGFDTSADGTRFYADGDTRVQMMPDKRLYPAPKINLGQEGESVQINAGVGLSDGSNVVPQLAAMTHNLLQSELLSTRQGRQKLIRRTMLNGAIPTEASERDGVITLRWLSLSPDAPEATAHLVQIDGDGVLRRFEIGGKYALEASYGEQSELALDMPDWPDLPVEMHDNPSPLITWAGRIMSLYSDVMKDAAAESSLEPEQN